MKKLFLIMAVVLPFLMCSCDPHKRIARIARNNPEVLQKDTVRVIDTIMIEGVRLDTVVTIKEFYTRAVDTLRFEKERLTVEIYHDTVHDQIYISGECDTIYKERTVEVPIEKIVVQAQNWWQRNNWNPKGSWRCGICHPKPKGGE